MSTTTSRGWDHPSADGWDPRGVHLRSDHRSDAEVGPRYLCSTHRQSTERLSDHHTAQVARQCPWCADPSKPEPPWTNGRVAETRRIYN